MSIGIRKIYLLGADVVKTSDNVLATLPGMVSPIGINETQKLRIVLPFNVGATGGIQYQIIVPAGGTLFLSTTKIVNAQAPAIVPSVELASAAVGNAVANAGDSFLEIDATIINGATAGNISLQAAQNTIDVLSLTVLKGGSMEVTTV